MLHRCPLTFSDARLTFTDARFGSFDARFAFSDARFAFTDAHLRPQVDVGYGTARADGEPFVRSKLSWSWQRLQDVPDRVVG